jgi:hypothetical protein
MARHSTTNLTDYYSRFFLESQSKNAMQSKGATDWE